MLRVVHLSEIKGLTRHDLLSFSNNIIHLPRVSVQAQMQLSPIRKGQHVLTTPLPPLWQIWNWLERARSQVSDLWAPCFSGRLREENDLGAQAVTCPGSTEIGPAPRAGLDQQVHLELITQVTNSWIHLSWECSEQDPCGSNLCSVWPIRWSPGSDL